MHFAEIICPNPGKVRSVKLGDKYHGVARCSKTGLTLLAVEGYDSPLAAANAARKYAKLTGQTETKQTKKLKTAKVAKTTKPPKSRVLLAEHEMTQHSRLRFKEVWLVRSVKDGSYVKTALDKEKKILVDYTEDKSKAKIFKSYEDANTLRKTFQAMYVGHHSVHKFFLDTENE